MDNYSIKLGERTWTVIPGSPGNYASPGVCFPWHALPTTENKGFRYEVFDSFLLKLADPSVAFGGCPGRSCAELAGNLPRWEKSPR